MQFLPHRRNAAFSLARPIGLRII